MWWLWEGGTCWLWYLLVTQYLWSELSRVESDVRAPLPVPHMYIYPYTGVLHVYWSHVYNSVCATAISTKCICWVKVPSGSPACHCMDSCATHTLTDLYQAEGHLALTNQKPPCAFIAADPYTLSKTCLAQISITVKDDLAESVWLRE